MPSYTLRDYQQEAVNAAIKWMKKNSDPAVLELSGGAGKSLIIAEIARILYQMTGKRVLCLVPSKTLAEQNGEKMAMTGEKFSFYSASISKSLRHKIVIATEGTFKKVASSHGSEFAAVLVDEADRVTTTFKQIIEDMREQNPLLRVIGLTGTPFRLQSGYIYELDLENRVVIEATDPYYKKLLYRVTCNELTQLGFLTPIQVGLVDDHYDTSNLKIDIKNETFTQKSLDEMLSDGSVTERIVQDFVRKTKDKKGVMVFCTSIKHAEDVYRMLPEGEAGILHGKADNQSKTVKEFKSQKIKYLVNVDMATVGFDAPHVDCLVLLRPTASNRLMQQILWRGVRLYDGKDHCLLLDYTDNIPNLFGDNPDIFTPQIKAYGSKPSATIEVMCEDCGTEQEFTKRPQYGSWDQFGYATDLAGDRLNPYIPAHFGRRCRGVFPSGKNQYHRCTYYWTCKECPECGHKNDIAARACESCGLTFIDPNSKLNETATVIPVGERTKTRVDAMTVRHGEVINVTFDTPHGEIKCRFFPNHATTHIARHGWAFNKATNNGQNKPVYIEYTKQKSGLCSINRYEME